MEPLKRATKFPSEWEVADIIQRYPGWLTALSEGTIDNPETQPTQDELLAGYYDSAADSMGVYKQDGMPNRRYLKGHFTMCNPEILEMMRPVIDKRDDTSFAVLHHIMAGAHYGLKDEIENALHYQQLLGISYFDAVHLVRSFSLYAKGFSGIQIADPRFKPSTLKQHLAVRSLIATVQEITPREDWGVRSDDILRISEISLGKGRHALRLNDKHLMEVAVEYADYIDPICRVMVDRKITSGPAIRELAESVVESIRSGVAPSLITGIL